MTAARPSNHGSRPARRSTPRRVLRGILAVVVSLTVVVFASTIVLLANYPAEYPGRLIAYQQSDVRDYLVFPDRAIAPAPEPRPFRQPADQLAAEADVRAGFERDPLVGDNLDAFLQQTGNAGDPSLC